MDEAEKYKQRLEAIAEKRRLQEEEDRARREMEDEKLRLQQLKRKSLRDQWLMEGAPSSPTSPDPQTPRSPLWGSVEKHRLQSDRQAEEDDGLQEQMSDGRMGAVEVAEEGVEIVHEAVVQNGEKSAAESGTTEGEAAFVLTNGEGTPDLDISHETSEKKSQSATNGTVAVTERGPGVEAAMSLVVSETEPGQVLNVSLDDVQEEEEEGTLVMRAERVIVTDEGDDASEDLQPQEDQQSEETSQPSPEGAVAGEDDSETVVKPVEAPETESEHEKLAEVHPTTEDGDAEGNEKANRDGETKDEAEGDQEEAQESLLLQSTANQLEGAPVAFVPVYSESTLSTVTPEAEDEVLQASEEAEAAVETAAVTSGQFQEVPLSDPQENHRTEAAQGEQEPLLSQAKATDTQVEPAAADTPANAATLVLTRAEGGGEAEVPKRKTCQCCSVM
ncbi:uncharacterized protein ACBR49_000926 [Aulostomus maculatus]